MNNMSQIQNKLTQEQDPEVRKMIIDFVKSIAKITDLPTATYELWETRIDEIIKVVRQKGNISTPSPFNPSSQK